MGLVLASNNVLSSYINWWNLLYNSLKMDAKVCQENKFTHNCLIFLGTIWLLHQSEILLATDLNQNAQQLLSQHFSVRMKCKSSLHPNNDNISFSKIKTKVNFNEHSKLFLGHLEGSSLVLLFTWSKLKPLPSWASHLFNKIISVLIFYEG